MNLKNCIFILIGLLTLVGCSTERRAAYHLKKAIKLNPNVVSTMDSVIKWDTVFRYQDTLYIKESNDSTDFDCEEIQKQLREKGEYTLIENDRLKVSLKQKEGENNKLKTVLHAQAKELKKPIDTAFVLTKEQVVTVKQVTVTVEKKGFFYYMGIIATVAFAIGLVIGITRLVNFKRNG